MTRVWFATVPRYSSVPISFCGPDREDIAATPRLAARLDSCKTQATNPPSATQAGEYLHPRRLRRLEMRRVDRHRTALGKVFFLRQTPRTFPRPSRRTPKRIRTKTRVTFRTQFQAESCRDASAAPAIRLPCAIPGQAALRNLANFPASPGKAPTDSRMPPFPWWDRYPPSASASPQ